MQTICFQLPESLNDALMAHAMERKLEADALIVESLELYLTGPSKNNRRAHDRYDVNLSAVARPVGDVVGSSILPGTVLDVSAGGVKLQCDYDKDDIDRLVQVGGRVEIIFTVPEKEYPVCFTCEVKHIFHQENSELGCEFVKSTGDSLEVLKELLSSAS
ncbi:PilZ domain-containing protein [Pseudodesulfovibrio sp. zrk46]|uniref:PilZ domain-containing protein n=1 Tax=Pseudodesulfovibrio sp. zrk46 TaxID=2725288 RepID=UPI001FFC310E|nr:PilZ domain-containing protein [Pseudodesulfovibrio sp. zrk46]